MIAAAPIFAAAVIYDIRRDGVGLLPVAFAVIWAAAAVVVALVILRGRRTNRPFLTVWLALWLLIGGLGLSNVFVQYSRCRAWAADGSAQVVEGRVTAYRPQQRGKAEYETLTVGAQTWTYSTSDLGAGGYRGVPSAKHLLREGVRVRVTTRQGRILRLEVLDVEPG